MMMRSDLRPRRVWSAAIAHTVTRPVIAVVMGVSGSGKTTVSALLAGAERARAFFPPARRNRPKPPLQDAPPRSPAPRARCLLRIVGDIINEQVDSLIC